MSELESYNDNIKYLLTVVEVFTRKKFVGHMTNKTTQSTVRKFSTIHQYVGKTPRTVYMDKGSEFNSTLFKEYCERSKIKPIFSTSSTKASICERAQRSLQDIMYKYMAHNSTKRYIDKLGDIVKAFNSRVNRTIGMSPNKAYLAENHNKVLERHELGTKPF